MTAWLDVLRLMHTVAGLLALGAAAMYAVYVFAAGRRSDLDGAVWPLLRVRHDFPQALATFSASVPLWLEEGYANHVGYAGSDVPPEQALVELALQRRAEHVREQPAARDEAEEAHHRRGGEEPEGDGVKAQHRPRDRPAGSGGSRGPASSRSR